MKKTDIKVEEFIRVDHAGERGAVKIYEGQLLALNTIIKNDDLKKTIEEYYFETKSAIAKKILDNFNYEINNFQQVCPIEMLKKLENPITLKSTVKEVG